jgi:uncharacterized membrane protein YeaQ/YmgE (transglycosylase-associated protein family)
MGILAWIILGALAGIIAERLTGARVGIVLATVVGIVGALLGGFLAKELFDVKSLDEFFDISTWLTAIIGAVILFFLAQLVTDRRSI